MSKRLTTVDVWTGEIRQIAPPARDPHCVCCGLREFVHLDGSKRVPVSLCGRDAVQIHERSRPLDLPDLARRLGEDTPIRANEFALRVTIDAYDLMIFPDEPLWEHDRRRRRPGLCPLRGSVNRWSRSSLRV